MDYRNSLEKLKNKIVFDKSYLLDTINKLKKENKKIVFTNGCFDIIHTGHIHYLAMAKDLGDFLIVALNSDESVKKIKGDTRPIHTLVNRMEVIASLFFVDTVTFFDEETPNAILSYLKPNIHVKGGDYQIEKLPEKKIIDSYGGEIKILPYVEGFSTTGIIQRIKTNTNQLLK